MKQLAIIMGILACAATAQAGLKLSYPVVVQPSFAWGAFGSARASADTVQMLQVTNSRSSSFLFARDAAGKDGMCTTTNPDLMAIARTATSGAYVYFAWDSTGACTDISVVNASYIAPAAP